METKYPAGRIAGIPVLLDQTFILLVLLFAYGYLKSGKPEMILVGLFVAAAGVGSILLHELAHAGAGRICGIGSTHIELNGLGGLCFLERASRDRNQEIFILLAGPASNLALWAMFYWLAAGADAAFYGLTESGTYKAAIGTPAGRLLWYVRYALEAAATLNIAMFVLNLMPSFPLDGGRALAITLSARMGVSKASSVVAHLGFLVCLGLVWYGIKYSLFALVVAYSLFLANKEMADLHDSPPWKRWF